MDSKGTYRGRVLTELERGAGLGTGGVVVVAERRANIAARIERPHHREGVELREDNVRGHRRQAPRQWVHLGEREIEDEVGQGAARGCEEDKKFVRDVG